MDPLLLTAARTLGTTVGRAVAKRTTNSILGEPESRQYDAACERAAITIVAETLGNAPSEQITHAADLIMRLIRYRFAGNQIPASFDFRTEIVPWNSAFEELGLDPQTFPLAFDFMVERLCQEIPLEISRAARRDNNPLFNVYAVELLEQLAAEVSTLSRGMGECGPWGTLPIEQGLDSSLKKRREVPVNLTTPFILYTILEPGKSRIPELFNALDPFLARRLRTALGPKVFPTARIDRARRSSSDLPSLYSRRDVQAAQRVSYRLHLPAVGYLGLLIGFLDVASSTREQLIGRVGPRLFSLRDAAVAEITSAESVQTPNHLFSELPESEHANERDPTKSLR